MRKLYTTLPHSGHHLRDLFKPTFHELRQDQGSRQIGSEIRSLPFRGGFRVSKSTDWGRLVTRSDRPRQGTGHRQGQKGTGIETSKGTDQGQDRQQIRGSAYQFGAVSERLVVMDLGGLSAEGLVHATNYGTQLPTGHTGTGQGRGWGHQNPPALTPHW